jgi:hypothetical protein
METVSHVYVVKTAHVICPYVFVKMEFVMLRNSICVALLFLFIGCKEKNNVEPTAEDYARAVAVIAKYNELMGIDIVRVEPKVGDKCVDCNDPPGSCGVGKVGDGVICVKCETCGGDGKMDDRDLSKDGPALEDNVEKTPTVGPAPGKVFINNEIVMLTRDDCYHCNVWKETVMKKFTDKGWVIKPVYYDGAVPVYQFKSKTGKDLEHVGPISIETFNRMFHEN